MLIRELLPQRGYRHNFMVMGLDLSVFILALSFASVYGVLPLFVHHLTVSNLALGLIPAVRAFGTLVPPILIAAYTERLRRLKPFILFCTVFERVPYLVLASLTLLFTPAHPQLLLWSFFVLIGIATLAGGVAMPAWLDLVARAMPGNWRGRFFGLFSALGALLGVAGGALAAELLHRYDWPDGFALCFGCTFACLVVSFIFLALAREPATSAQTHPHHDGERVWRRWPALIAHDRNFARYLVINGLVTMAGMGTAFYTVDAERSLHLSDAAAGLYAVVLLVASTIGNVLWGYLGDHAGHKCVLEGGAFCTGLAALCAVAARLPHGGPLIYGLAFVLVGLGSSGIQMAALTFVLDMAPAGLRPTYVGLASIAQAPFAALAPLLGGLVADHAGYPAVFVLTALLALAGALLIISTVGDPRAHSARAMPALPDDSAMTSGEDGLAAARK